MAKEGELSLRFVADFPPSESSSILKATDSVATLRTEIGKKLSIESSVGDYLLLGAIYGSDVIMLDDPKATLSGLGVKTQSTILVRAPVGVAGKMPVKRPKEGKEDEEDKKTEVKDKYKGFTVKSALSQLTGPKSKLAYEYTDIYAGDIIKLPDFLKLPLDQLVNIVKRDTLNVEEAALFEAVVNWGKAEAKRKDAGGDAEVLRKLLADVLPHIRFPVMNTTDVASKVSPTGILDSQQILDLFTYLATKASGNKDAKPGDSLKFPTKERKGAKKPNWFVWDSTYRNPYLNVSSDGLTVTSTQSQYMTVFGNAELKSGVHEFELYLSNVNTNGYACIIGVAPSTSRNMYANNMMLGYQNHIPGWAFAVSHARKYHNKQEKYGRKATNGQTVKTRVDLDKKTIEFFINNESLGVAYTDVTGPVLPALSLYANNSVELRFGK